MTQPIERALIAGTFALGFGLVMLVGPLLH